MNKGILVFICLMFVLTSCAPAPENCAICAADIRSAGLLNLQTGEIWEIELTGDAETYSFINAAGITAWLSTELRVHLTKGENRINRARFCTECRKMLKSAGEYSHALISPEKEVLTLENGAQYEEAEFILEVSDDVLTAKRPGR